MGVHVRNNIRLYLLYAYSLNEVPLVTVRLNHAVCTSTSHDASRLKMDMNQNDCLLS